MTLLNEVLLSSAFKAAITTQRRAIEVFSDQSLYATDPGVFNKPDFLTKVLIQQLGDRNNNVAPVSVLEALAAELNKLPTLGTTAERNLNIGVLAALAEHFYFLPDVSQAGFFESISGGIRFDLSKIAPNSDHRGSGRLKREVAT